MVDRLILHQEQLVIEPQVFEPLALKWSVELVLEPELQLAQPLELVPGAQLRSFAMVGCRPG